jgi:DNA topoisomerase-1
VVEIARGGCIVQRAIRASELNLVPNPKISPAIGAVPAAAKMARSAGLIYVSDGCAGYRRRRAGKGFAYFLPDDRRLKNPVELKRIASLAVPPAYENVWICMEARGHLQATGRDARGRKQYRYHPDWRRVRDHRKFDRMTTFAEALPRLRRRIARDMALDGLPRQKVLALVISLLDATHVRVGNAEYARDNKSFGLTTLLNRHVSFAGEGRVRLNFRGKGGVPHEVLIDDKRISRVLRCCQELPGTQLFQYLTDDGKRARIDSGQVNEYLRSAMGDDFTAKDFRTWSATLRAVTLLARAPLPDNAAERSFKSGIAAVVRQVADELRNTPAVCRKSYINPMVFDAWRSGRIRRAFSGGLRLASARKSEARVLAFLSSYRPAPADRTARPTRVAAAN